MKTLLFCSMPVLILRAANAFAQENSFASLKVENPALVYAMSTHPKLAPTLGPDSHQTSSEQSPNANASNQIENEIRPLSFPAIRPALTLSTTTTARFDRELFDIETTRRSSHFEENGIRTRFSFKNLLGGSLYDFQRRDQMRLELGGPGVGDWELSPLEYKYEKPFTVLIFLRVNL